MTLPDNAIAIVFNEDGTLELRMPKGFRDDDKVPDHVLLATAIAIKARRDMVWADALIEELIQEANNHLTKGS